MIILIPYNDFEGTVKLFVSYTLSHITACFHLPTSFSHETGVYDNTAKQVLYKDQIIFPRLSKLGLRYVI